MEKLKNLKYLKMVSENDIDLFQIKQKYNDLNVSKYLSVSDNYFRYVTSTKNVFYYKVFNNEQLIGTLHIEKQENVLNLAILVFPEFQNAGYGTKIIKDVQNDIFKFNFEKIEISIDKENFASIKLFEKTGFKLLSEEGELLNYFYKVGL